ncbi:MAG TPA: aminotransferase [Thermoanaerobaculia bacterium]|nr:aminotransferase [Thermoanaerobaculia bacterium]
MATSTIPAVPGQTTERLVELDKRASFHPYTQLAAHLKTGPTVIVSGEGVRVRDSHGREYIDAMAGLWCVNVGWGRTEIADAIARQARELAFFHSFSSMANEPAIALAARIADLAPDPIGKIFFGCTGSDANDTNVKLIWYYHNLIGKPRKKKLIARKRAYHGVTVASASLSGLPSMHRGFDLPLPQVLHVETPHHWSRARDGESEREFSARLAREVEETIEREGPDTVAAFFAEPVMGAGGVIPPPEGYFEAIVPVLRRHDVLFVVDEVICGFGRLGRWFGAQMYGLEPDLMTLAKGLTSGYQPLSASLVSERVWNVLLGAEKDGYFAHGFTYSAHPVCAAAALVNLDLIEQEDLVGNAERTGAFFQRELRAAVVDHPLVGEVRGLGLIAAVELVADKAGKTAFPLEQKVAPRVARIAWEEGLICRALPESNALSFSPPLVITEDDCRQVVARFARALERFERELGGSG